MNKLEREFYNDICDAVSDWNCDLSYYHRDDYGQKEFCVDITINDDPEEWDNVWNAVNDAIDDWYAGIDSSGNEIYVALHLSD